MLPTSDGPPAPTPPTPLLASGAEGQIVRCTASQAPPLGRPPGVASGLWHLCRTPARTLTCGDGFWRTGRTLSIDLRICGCLLRAMVGFAGRPGYVGFKQHAAHVGDVHNADQAGVSDDRQVPKTPARHDFGRVTDAGRGVDDGRVSSHHLIN